MMRIVRNAARWAVLTVLVLSAVLAQAQERRVTGQITTSSENQGLPGANVQVKGTTIGTVTDADGNYSLTVPGNNAVLVFSSIGFMKQEVTVGSQSVINISLSDDVKSLSEVIVTGYGTQSKRDITGAVSTIDVKQALAVPATNLAQAMQGRVAGVNVSNDNSPGGGVMVRIRGFGTINDNSPLYVIDGTPTKGSLNSLNLNDIESMQVLKDASAASIYGARAGNGVVIITTKKGKAGKPKLTYDTYYGTQSAWRGLDLLNTQEYANVLWRSRINALNTLVNGVATPNAGQSGLVYPSNAQFGNGATPVIPDYIIPGGAKEGDPRADPSRYVYDPFNPSSRYLISRANKEGTDWFGEMFNPAPIQNHQLGVSGGNENGRYAMSLNLFDQRGIMQYTYYKRYSLRANTEFNVTSRVRVGENFQVALDERVGQTNGNQNESNPISFAFRIQPIIPVRDIMGNYAGTSGPDLDNSRNPIAELWRNKDNVGRNVRLFGNAYAEVDIAKNLTARTQFGVDYNLYNMRSYRAVDLESSENAGANQLDQTNNYEWTWTWYNTLTYKTSFLDDRLSFSVLAGTESIKSFWEQFTARRQRFASDDIENRYLDAGNPGTSVNSGTAADWRLASEFAKANFSFNDKYLLDLTVRRDRSSRFAEAFRIAYFPAVSAGWRISNEGFMKGISWLDDLKIRAAWGQTGNQEIGNYNPFGIFGTNAAQNFYDLNGANTSSVQGYDRFQFANPRAKWETTTSTDLGFDAVLLRGKVDLNFDWFNRRTSDMLFRPDVQRTQGVATVPFQNIGEMVNKGVELGLNYNGSSLNGDLRYSVGANISTYRNQVVALTGDPATQYFGFTTRLPAMSVTQAGQPIGSFFGYVIDGFINTDEEGTRLPAQFGGGVNNKAGNFKFVDVNGDGIINASDRTIIGTPHPDFSYGINVSVSYKAFRLDLFGQGVQGNQIFNYVRYWTDFPTFGGNRSKRMLNESWEPGKTDAKLPILRSNDVVSSQPSTYYLEDGSYMRLKNVQLTYTIPTKILSKVGLGQASVYLQGQNWLTFTKYTGLDPEINLRNSSGTDQDRQIGVDEGAYPAYRATLVGLSLSF
ncbi:TonB-linked SusC/RagA family outer membrane protein [Rhabdobacter roseus]|uniref:TonB-linked SusC/RagA family outer membrane protein n=1 Tax=Rhabdobacter roseus TaxID=1655419 RepID=A0A840TU01_9BACT|nr:TonB-dependent receptor [Rhabdobacter roseus]MBB5285147.1 TonB-linked SusC/RagA family outer membrane protein [Rhabdobacter roseus]